MPKITSTTFIRVPVKVHQSSAGAAAVSPDFTGTGALTIFGPHTVGQRFAVEKLRFHVGAQDFAGAAGTATFKLRKGIATGTVLATLTITLTAALRGVTLEAAVAAADDEASKCYDTDTLTLTRDAGGTVFTTGEGVFEVIARVPGQAKN